MYFCFDVIHRGSCDTVGVIVVGSENIQLRQAIESAKYSAFNYYNCDLDKMNLELELVEESCDLEFVQKVAADRQARVKTQAIAAMN